MDGGGIILTVKELKQFLKTVDDYDKNGHDNQVLILLSNVQTPVTVNYLARDQFGNLVIFKEN